MRTYQFFSPINTQRWAKKRLWRVNPSKRAKPIDIKPRASTQAGLTDADFEVIDYIAAFGLNNRQISLAMNTTENAVKMRLRSAMDKIGLSTRLEIAKWRLAHAGVK